MSLESDTEYHLKDILVHCDETSSINKNNKHSKKEHYMLILKMAN